MRAAAAHSGAAFPDWHSDIGFYVEEGDLVVENFTASGTQQGEIFGVPPSGRTVSLPGINIWRVRDGRIVERWGRLDDLGLMRQLGLVPQQVWGDLKRRSALAARRDEYRRDHGEIVTALRLRDADRATAAMRTHLTRVSRHLLSSG